MNKTMIILKRYALFLVFFLINVVLLVAVPEVGRSAFSITWSNILEMMSILPAIFILLGLLDVWVDREVMSRYMGENSGLKGMLIAFALGSAAAGPLYAAFPIAGIFIKKGAKLMNVFIFIGAWSTTKIPLLLFETASLGTSFMLLRLACNIAGIVAIAVLLDKTISHKTKQAVYDNAQIQ